MVGRGAVGAGAGRNSALDEEARLGDAVCRLPRRHLGAGGHCPSQPARSGPPGPQRDAADRFALARRAFSHRSARCFLPRRRQCWRRRGEPVRAWLWPARRFARSCVAVLSGLPRRHEHRGAGGRCFQFSRRLGVHVADLLGARGLASSRSGECACRLYLSPDGRLRHAGAAARFRRSGRWPVITISPRSAPSILRQASPAPCCCSR